VFFRSDNYRLYLSLWKEISARYGLDVHAYCLMTNYIHFLITPSDEHAVSRVISAVGSRYAFAINRQLNRTGTIWEGRHKSSLVDTDNYLLACYRYIEQNPLRAKMVTHPSEYRWSSYRANAGQGESWLVPHDSYLALGNTTSTRNANYRTLLEESLSRETLNTIRNSANYCHPIGDELFKATIENEYAVNLGMLGVVDHGRLIDS